MNLFKKSDSNDPSHAGAGTVELKEADSLLASGAEFASRGLHERAVVEYAKALKRYREIGCRGGEAVALANLGCAQAQVGGQATVQGLATITEALRFFKEADDKEHIAECLFNMADAQMKNGLVFEAIETFRQCREIAQRVGNRELTSKVEGVLAQAEKFGVLSDPESAHGDKLRPGFAPATGAFSQLLSRIEVALSSEDIEMAERLLWSAGECASEQGMMGHVHLKQKQSAGSRDPSRIIEMGIMISVLIEDTGHKEKRMDFVTSAEQFLQLLMRYAELATCANALGYRALKDGLKLQITSGAYYGAAVVVELAFVTSKTVSALEAISMCNNRAAIQLKLGNLVKAEALFSQALSLMAGHVPQELRGAITRNLKGVRTGYDPDFLFLPD